MSRRRDWSPTGVLVPSSRVKLYRRTVIAASKPEKVIVRLAGLPSERKEAFPTKTAAKAYLRRLERVVGDGDDFDAGSFAPADWGRPPAPEPVDQPMTWLTWVCQHIDDMAAAGDKGKTKESRHEALKVAVWTLVDDVPDHPGRDALKAYLEIVGDPVFVDPALPPTARDAERARLRAERLAQLPDQVFPVAASTPPAATCTCPVRKYSPPASGSPPTAARWSPPCRPTRRRC